jgi:hypothetical protein
MRTTLTLDDDLAETLNRKARHSGRSFKEVVNAAIRRGLALGEPLAENHGQAFVVHPQACGLMPGIDPLRFNQLLDQLDGEQFQAVQTRDCEPT